jgi:DNA invertase Pin-like site-specific DNA recombinase
MAASGERNGMAKLSEDQARQIHELARSGFSQRQLAKMFNVTKTPIAMICREQGWRHLWGDELQHNQAEGE